jgi:hypothetical protein
MDARPHGGGQRHRAQVLPLGRGGLGPHDGLEESQGVRDQVRLRERLLPHRHVHVARLVHAELDLARLGLAHRPRHVEGHGAQLRVGHEAARPQHLAEPAHLAHEIGGGDRRVEVHEAALDLLDQVLGADHVGPRIPSFLVLLALGEDGHPHRLADAVGQHDGAPHHLVGVLGIDPEPQGHVHRLVELGVGQLLEDAERLLDRVALLAVVDRLGGLQLLRRHWHRGLPCPSFPAVLPSADYRSAGNRLLL